MVGYKTKLSHFITMIIILSLHNYTFSIANAGDRFMNCILIWTFFLPLGRSLSFDSLFSSLYNFKEKDFSLFDITNEIEVECATASDSLNKLNIKNLDFLKIDAQGAELEILKGLGEYRPPLIKTEVQVVSMYEDAPNWSELMNYLYKINYMTSEWSEIGPHLTRSPVEMDMIFIPNYLNDIGKKLILSREKEFTSLMIIFGQIKLLQAISKKLNFSNSLELNNIKDKFFY